MANTIFIYRPDHFSSKINNNCLYTPSGKSYQEWKRDEEVKYNYKVQKKIERAERIPDHKVFDFWRNE